MHARFKSDGALGDLPAGQKKTDDLDNNSGLSIRRDRGSASGEKDDWENPAIRLEHWRVEEAEWTPLSFKNFTEGSG